MQVYQTGEIRNIGIAGHSGAGKTSLLETMLFNSGFTSRLGKVEDGTTVTDYLPEEIKRQVTISASLAPVEWNGTKLNIDVYKRQVVTEDCCLPQGMIKPFTFSSASVLTL